MPQMRKIFIEADSRGDMRGVATAMKPPCAPRRWTGAARRRGDRRDAPPAAPAPAAPPAHRGPNAGVRIGLVFDVGGRGDKSFNDAAYAGLLRAQKELGVDRRVPRAREQRGPRGRDAPLRRARASTSSSAWASSSRATSTASRATSRACTSRASTTRRPPTGAPPNVAGLAFREEEGSYLVGGVAGLDEPDASTSGFVGGMRGPLIRKFEAGYEAGVKAACPDCTVHSAYVGTSPDAFKDPAKGKALAIARDCRRGRRALPRVRRQRARRLRGRARRADASPSASTPTSTTRCPTRRHEHGQARRRLGLRHDPRGHRAAASRAGCTSSA